MFVPGSTGKVPPLLSDARHTNEYTTGQPLSNLKSIIPQRPVIDKMRIPLLRQVDDELRKLKSQFDMIKNDQYLPKTYNVIEPNESHNFTSSASNTLNGLVNLPSTVNKPTSSNSGLLSAISSNANKQFNFEPKSLGIQPYSQNKKITQSFQTNKDNFIPAHSPESGKIFNNPEQLYKPINLAWSEKLSSYKPFSSYQTQQMAESKPQQPQSNINNFDRKQPLPDRRQKLNPHQFRPQNTTLPNPQQTIPSKATKDTKINVTSQPPPYKPYSNEQYKSIPIDIFRYASKKNDIGKAQATKQPIHNGAGHIQNAHFEIPKIQSFKSEPDCSPNGSNLIELGHSSPIQKIRSSHTRTEPAKPESLPSSVPSSGLNTQREQKGSSPKNNQPKIPQQETKNPTIQTQAIQSAHNSPDATKVETGHSVQNNLSIIEGASNLSPSNDIQRHNAFQSERVRYQDPNPYVSPEARRAAQMKDRVIELSPGQRERHQSIMKYQSRKLGDLEQRIGTLTKSNDSLNYQNAQLKHQVTHMTEQLKKINNIKADHQSTQTIIKQTNEKYHKLSMLFEEAQVIIGKRDRSIKDLQIEIKRLKETIEADKSEGGFNMALKAQIEQNQRVKDRFTQKDEEIEELRQLNQTLRTKLDNIKNDIEIEKLKHMTEIKNKQTKFDIEIQKLTSQVESMRKVMSSLDEKFKYIMKEDRKKDEFLVNYLKGKTHDPNDKELIINFFKQFEEVPKLTISQLLREEYRIQEELKKEVHVLKALLPTCNQAPEAYI